jgi:hypothetical protein
MLFWALFVWLIFLAVCAVSVIAGWVAPARTARPWLVLLVCPVLATWMALGRWS